MLLQLFWNVDDVVKSDMIGFIEAIANETIDMLRWRNPKFHFLGPQLTH